MFKKYTSFSSIVMQGHAYLLRHRTAVMVFLTFVLALAVYVALHSRTDMSTLSFFPDTNPELVQMAEALHMAPFSRLLMVDFSINANEKTSHTGKTYTQEDLLGVAEAVLKALPKDLASHATAVPDLHPEQVLPLIPSLVDAQALEYLEKQVQAQVIQRSLQSGMEQLQQLWGAISLPWLQHDPLNFRQILLSRLPASQSFGQVHGPTGLVLSEDGQHVLLVLRPQFSMHDVDKAAQLMYALDDALKKHVPNHVQVLSTGAHRHSAANASTIEADIKRIVCWSLVGFALVYVFLVRSVSGALWLLATPVAAGLLAWGAVALSWPLIAGLALGFGASILGIAEDYAMHMHFALRHGRARGQSSAEVLCVLYKPLVQAFLLNAAGFSVLLFSSIPALRQLAALALFTLAGGLFLALVILPLWTSFAVPALPSPTVKKPCSHDEFSLRKGAACVCVALLLVGSVFLWKMVQVDVSPRSMGADVAKISQDMQNMQKIWGFEKSDQEHVFVVQGESVEQTLQRSKVVVQELTEAGHDVQSLASLWPSAQEIEANKVRWQDFVTRHAQLFTMVQKQGEQLGFTEQTFVPFQAWLDQKPHTLTISLLQQAGLGALWHSFVEQGKNNQGQDRVFSLVLVNAEGKAEEKAGQSPMISGAVAEYTVLLSASTLEKKLLQALQAEQYLLPVTGGICLLLLLVFSPRKKDILLAALPPLVAINGILVVFLWQDIPLTLASMAALPLVLGLAVDHGIVMTHELGEDKDYGVQRAIVTSSCTAILGMGLLMLAEHPALHSMGQVIVAGLVVEMPVALWIIPLFYKKSSAV